MIIHFHHSLSPNSGDVKRICNIDKELATVYRVKTIEVVFCPLRKLKKVRGEWFFKLSSNTIRKYCIPLIPRAGVINDYYEAFILFAISLYYRPTAIIGEMYFPKTMVGLIRSFLSKVEIIADIHGAAVDEELYVNPALPKERLNMLIERDKYTTTKADYVLCQSDEMKRYINEKYKVSNEKICVYRCGYDSSLFKIDEDARHRIRKELRQENNVLFVYSGGLHKWQRVEDSIRIFKRYHEHNSASSFLILTGDQISLNTILSKQEFCSIKDSIISTSVPFKEVPSYLNACDVAFLQRDNHVMNAVASPTKLAEYMACGLPVITSEVSKFWITPEAHSFIIVDDNIANNESIDTVLTSSNKQGISQYALKNLSLELDNNNLVKFFGSK